MFMRKFASTLFVLGLGLQTFIASSTHASDGSFEVPKLEEFLVSSDTVELTSSSPTLDFKLKVSHPIGISSTKTVLWFVSRDLNIKLSTVLNRDSTIIKNEFVFLGKLTLPRSTPPGIYDFYAEPIEGLSGRNIFTIPKTDYLYPKTFNTFRGAEKSVLVRLSGLLNLNSNTFVGPNYSSTVRLIDNEPINFLNDDPIFKVGEIYNPEKYFTLRAPELKLKIASHSPEICIEDKDVLRFIHVGTCSFKVFTEKNDDFLSTSLSLSANITSARTKNAIGVPIIRSQDARNLPKLLNVGPAYSSAAEIIFPRTITPDVCIPSSNSVLSIISGGICTITYQSDETPTYLASDLYTVSFEVTRDPQTVTLTLPSTANVSTRSITLAATATSGRAITYSTASAGICSITGSTLNLLKNGNCEVTATQAGTSTLAPASATATVAVTGAVVSNRKTITCVKGKSTKKISGVNPKCPKGFKIKR
jgi:hypothetical protein